MTDKSKKQKKATISEEDVSTLLQKYSATTVLALLQEVAQLDGARIDWDGLVKKTTTGITSAREYQMLWRHLAYRHALDEKLDDVDQPLDDDSDLDCELEAFPPVSSEASMEAAACVKVLIASGLPSDSSHPNRATVEAPLTINIPNGQSFTATSENTQPAAMRGMNITVPVSVQKQPLPTLPSTDGVDANGSTTGINSTKKRRKWSEEEDNELIAAVQKFGEGNWANILRADFKGDRTASQLSQRWSIIKKRQQNMKPGTNSSGSQLSEAQRAARHAMNLALDPPAKYSITNSCVIAEVSPAQYQTSQCPIVSKSPSTGSSSSTAKSQATLKIPPAKPSLNSDPIRAAAVAAGARIATQSDAASLLKAAHAKNAIHIMPSGSSSIRSSMSAGAPTHLEAHPNVHFSSGLAATSHSTHPAGSRPGLVKPSSPAVQQNLSTSAPSVNVPSKQTNGEFSPEHDPKSAGGIKSSASENVTKEQVQDGVCISGNEATKQAQKDEAGLAKEEAELKSQVDVAPCPNGSREVEMTDSECLANVMDNPAEGIQSADDKSNILGLPDAEDKNQSVVEKVGKQNDLQGIIKQENEQGSINANVDNQGLTDKESDPPSIVSNECSQKLEGVSKAGPGMSEAASKPETTILEPEE